MKTPLQNIELICLPPNLNNLPLAGQTAIKSFLEVNGYICNISYLNIAICGKTIFKQNRSASFTLLPYIYIYNKIVCRNLKKAEQVKNQLLHLYADTLSPVEIASSIFDAEIDKLLSILKEEIEKIIARSPLFIGFSSKFNQWIPAAICAHLIKQKGSDRKILIGGWSTQSAAHDILNLVHSFDFSIWGEGEISVKLLSDALAGKGDIASVPQLTYREANSSLTENRSLRREEIIDLNELPFFNFDDYLSVSNLKEIVFPIEKSRGCSWNRCSFCYLSQGYFYREKNNRRFLSELETNIRKYHVLQYQIMDNNFVGQNVSYFDKLLNGLLEIKKRYPGFKITLAEIMPKGLTKKIIRKMSECGVEMVQIGLESISQSTLNKFKKKQTLAENLFFIKEALDARIKLTGANIIIDNPDETAEDIRECFHNLYYFRFFLSREDFNIDMVNLTLSNYSRYLNMVKKCCVDANYSHNTIAGFIDLPEGMDRFSLFEYSRKISSNNFWVDVYEQIKIYKEKKYSYNILLENNVLVYKEYTSGNCIITEPISGLYLHLLLAAEERVESLESILASLKVPKTEVINAINKLKEMGIIYCTDDYCGIVSIISLHKNIK